MTILQLPRFDSNDSMFLRQVVLLTELVSLEQLESSVVHSMQKMFSFIITRFQAPILSDVKMIYYYFPQSRNINQEQ